MTEREFADTLLNPSLIVEVLSESTEAYDRGEKFAHYRRLETLREYVLVAQDKIRIEHYPRQGEQWVPSRSATRARPSICRRSTAISAPPRSTKMSSYRTSSMCRAVGSSVYGGMSRKPREW